MTVSKIIYTSLLTLFLLTFNHNAFSDTVPSITINITNLQSIPFYFTYNNEHNNICTKLTPNVVKCKIYNKNVLGFILNLSWINLKKINCGVNLLLYGDEKNYIFQFNSTYEGSSFTPNQWDGHSDIVTNLVVGTGRCKAYMR